MLKKSILLILLTIILIISAVHVEALSVKLDVIFSGTEEKILEKQIVNQSCSFDEETNETACINETITVEQNVESPWQLSQSMEVDCDTICYYQIPSFTKPLEVTIEEYSLDYEKNDEYKINFESTNKKITTKSSDRIKIEVTQLTPDTFIQIEKVSPKNLTKGIDYVNILIKNEYASGLYSMIASLSGDGISTVSSSKIDVLLSGDSKYLSLTVNSTKVGELGAVIKINFDAGAKKVAITYADSFFVSGQNLIIEEVNETLKIQNDSTILNLSLRVDALKEQLKKYESDYLEKKSEGYLVSEIYDSIKDARSKLQNAQLAVSEGNSKDAEKYLLLAQLSTDDVKTGLENARKTQKTFFDKIKENAVLITTVSAAIVAIIGLMERQKSKMNKLKEKMKAMKEKKLESKKSGDEKNEIHK